MSAVDPERTTYYLAPMEMSLQRIADLLGELVELKRPNVVKVTAPNYVGSGRDLRAALVDMNRPGRLLGSAATRAFEHVGVKVEPDDEPGRNPDATSTGPLGTAKSSGEALAPLEMVHGIAHDAKERVVVVNVNLHDLCSEHRHPGHGSSPSAGTGSGSVGTVGSDTPEPGAS